MAGGARSYLAAFAELHTLAGVDERRSVARQGLAMLAEIAEREPAPLEGLAQDQLLLSVRVALADGLLAELDGWLSPASAAIALFELAQALPAGAERRELGRRVLVRLREADRDMFVRLLISLARTSPKIVASEGLRARLEVVLAAPLTAPGLIGELAIGLLAQPALAQSWVEVPATGSLPGRRLAARILAHGAREAVRRFDAGDRGGIRVLARAGTRAALARLLGDREALVWRFASIARGILAHVDSGLADDIDRELRSTATNTELRRASASAAAALERGGGARRWMAMLTARAREPGIARGTILGLAGLAITSSDEADDLAEHLVQHAPLEAAEALADLRREEAAPLLADAASAALAWARAELKADPDMKDDGRWGLLRALDGELSGSASHDGIGVPIAAARAALDVGDIPTALREARTAVDEISAAAEWLRDATDDDPVDRRHSMRLLRELDRELLADNALYAVLALAGDNDPARARFATALAAIEAALLAREKTAEAGAVAHGGLRIARLRALVRLLDGVRVTSDADLAPRLAAMRQLMERAERDHSSLRRAVWAAMTRAGDALLRDGYAEITDLLLAWTTTFHDEDFAIVREASMVPEIEASFEAYAQLEKATWEASDPDDADAVRAVVERLGDLADALPPEQSPRVESVRLALARLGNQLLRLARAGSQRSVPSGTFDAIANELGTLARRVFGARQRLGLAATETSVELETAIRAIETALGTRASASPRGPDSATLATALDEAIGGTIDLVRGALPPALAATIERVFVRLARRPFERTGARSGSPVGVVLSGWVLLSLFFVCFCFVRSIGRAAGGSVLLAVRAEQRNRPERELVALKVPDYSGDAARAMAEDEFEQMFREEAGALLALPSHKNIARFITFDAGAQPKPVLVMEFVRGTNLERILEASELDTPRALKIVDDLFAGLEAMHAVQIAHLDVKPPNLVLRDGAGDAVLVDFGLAGRRIRTGCGSAHYGAAEVWDTDGASAQVAPFATDVYAAAALAYEVLTGELLFAGDSLQALLAQHFSASPAGKQLAQLARRRELAPLADLLSAALARDARKRPTIARLRAGFAAIERDLRKLQWPLRP